MAQARDVEGLSRLLQDDNTVGHSPFNILRTNGAYEVGKLGWHALSLKGISGEVFVVFSTSLTSEDTGELVFRSDGRRLTFVPESESFGVRLVRHSFDLKFDIANKKATLVDRLKLTSKSGGPSAFLFRMSPQYIVSSIQDGFGKAIPFHEAGGVVSTQTPGREDTYTISYSAIVDLPNYAGSIGKHEATLTNDYWYPMVARQPVPYDIAIHTLPSWTAIGQGDLVDEKVTNSERLTRFKMDLPCVFYSVSAGPFKKYSQTINDKTYSCWSSLLTKEQMEAQSEFYAPIIEFYERFSPFPFKGYGAIDSEVYGGGALEAYSFTTWGHGALPSEDAHEPSHTWWGGVINNTYLESFWNESFAVFSEGLFRRNVPIGRVDERKLAFIREADGDASYNSVPLAKSGADVGGIASTLGYGKGSQVLQMLEQILGTDSMIETMKEWIKKSKGTASDWGDYEAVVARLHPDLNIKSFFDDWIRKPGFANLKVSEVQYSSGHVTMNVGFNGLSYRIPLEVMVQFEDGTRQFHRVDLAAAGPIALPTNRKPVLVSVDPWRRVLRQTSPNETPVELKEVLGHYQVVCDPSHHDYLPGLGSGTRDFGIPQVLAGKFLIGHPDTMPLLRGLCKKVGFVVAGNRLTYDGTTIDLDKGCAMAVVDLGGGRNCIIGLGRSRVAPEVGRARLVLTDSLGRFIRGITEPKTTGSMTFRL